MEAFKFSSLVFLSLGRITHSHVSDDTYCSTQAKLGPFSQTKWSTPATKQPYLLANPQREICLLNDREPADLF